MPTSLSGSPLLCEVLPPRLRPLVEKSLERILRDPNEFEKLKDSGALPEPYWDPALRKSRKSTCSSCVRFCVWAL